MANQEHVDRLQRGAAEWNAWRVENPHEQVDLTEADLRGLSLPGIDLSHAEMMKANLYQATLAGAKLCYAHLQESILSSADLTNTDLSGTQFYQAILLRAKLTNAHALTAPVNFSRATLDWAELNDVELPRAVLYQSACRYTSAINASLIGARMTEALLRFGVFNNINLEEADLRDTEFSHVELVGAHFSRAMLGGATFAHVDLTDSTFDGAILSAARFLDVDLKRSRFNRCNVYGISVWSVDLHDVEQSDLVITPFGAESPISVDSLEVAQFLHLLINNATLRTFIDTVTTKVVLILGRFTNRRKPVLDALRAALRHHGYVPVLFDFAAPRNRTLSETVVTIAHLSRFVVADLTNPRSIPHELSVIIPHVPSVPILPLLHSRSKTYSMFEAFTNHPWVLPIHRYSTIAQLISEVEAAIISPAEAKATELKAQRTSSML